MNKKSLLNLTLKHAKVMLDAKEISGEELTKLYLESANELDPKLNAYLDIFQDAPGGLPCSIKDAIMVKGKRCTAGSKILENYTASFDATSVIKLKQHGVSILGKNNCDEFTMGTTGEHSAYGPTLNPLDTNRVPGGSSSGSAAAVSANMALFSLGTDTGGSIRLPASWCGVVGLKPTYGRVSRHGEIAMAAGFYQTGPITKTVEDAAIVLGMIAGHDPLDAASSPHPVPDYTAVLGKDIKGFKIGVPKEFFLYGLDKQVDDSIKKAIKQFEKLGARIDEVSLPMTDYAIAAYYILVPSEVSADMARYDGIRYGYSDSDAKNLFEVYVKSRSKAFGNEVSRRILIGTYALSAGYYDAYYKKAQQVRTIIRQDFDRIFMDYDVIVGPTAPVMAPKVGEFDNPLAFYLADVYTVQPSLAGLCAISVPCGFGTIDGVKLPIGLQIIANRFEEEKLFQIAYAYEQSILD